MSELTTYGENKAATDLLGTGTFYIALHSADPTETGAVAELAAANGYARQSATFTIVGDTADNDAQVQFGPATADQGTVTHFTIWDAVTAGNCLVYSPLDASRAWSSGTLTFAAGAITVTFA